MLTDNGGILVSEDCPRLRYCYIVTGLANACLDSVPGGQEAWTQKVGKIEKAHIAVSEFTFNTR